MIDHMDHVDHSVAQNDLVLEPLVESKSQMGPCRKAPKVSFAQLLVKGVQRFLLCDRVVTNCLYSLLLCR